MIVRLTNRGRERVWQRVLESDTRYKEALSDWWFVDYTVASKHRVDTVMPAIAWKIVEEIMFLHCFDLRGFVARDRAKSSDLTAIKTIRRALNARENHPALSRRGAIGQISELLPVWTIDPDTDSYYTPYPITGGRFAILAPEIRTVDLKTTTLWVEVAGRVPQLRILDRHEHERFLR